MKQSEIFARAREELAARGLTKFSWEDHSGCLCTMGAVRLVVFGSASSERFLSDDITYTLREALDVRSVIAWNDRPETTHLDSVVALEKAHLYALKLEAEGLLPEVDV